MSRILYRENSPPGEMPYGQSSALFHGASPVKWLRPELRSDFTGQGPSLRKRGFYYRASEGSAPFETDIHFAVIFGMDRRRAPPR